MARENPPYYKSLQVPLLQVKEAFNIMLKIHPSHRRTSSARCLFVRLIEEMTAVEFLSFHQQFKSFLPGITLELILAETGLTKAANKQIRYYSSGMKQRMKLAQAIFSDTPVLLLDEPCTNLDKSGIALYRKFMQTHAKDRLVVISSNDEAEYDFCNTILQVTDWKNEHPQPG
jgi:ABC-type multidrug transport system ATPase subunit